MTKSPEELAEEWSRTPRQNQDVDEYQLSWDFVCEWEKESFLAGYQAAKDQYEVRVKKLEDSIIQSVNAMAGVKYDDENT